jgi:hypothetical protein
MANENEKPVQKVDTPAGLSNETLLKMLIDSQRQQADAQKELAAALIESRKPYVDPKVLAQKQQELEEKRKAIEIELRNRQARKAGCPHIRDNGTPNIKWMEHSNGITKGVCGGCFSEFDTRNQADLQLLRRDIKSIRNMGRAGNHARIGTIGA